MSVLKVKNGNQWDIVPAIKGDPGDPAADESITDDMLVTDGIKTEIEWLWGNQLTDSCEGELLHAEDAYTAPAVDISVDGKSTQVTTTGKNLLSDQIAADWVRRPAGAVVNDKWWTFIPVDDGASYHFHDTGTLGLEAGWADVTDYSSYSQIVTLTNLRNYTFTNSGNHAYLAIICSGSYTAEYIYEHIHSTSAIIESGTSFTSYEPYTGGKPSPSPDYPQEIVSVNQAGLQFSGRNIFDFNFVDQYTIPSGGVRFTANGDGTFTVEAIADSGGSKTVSIIQGTGFRHINQNYPISVPSTVEYGAFQLPAGTYTFRSYSSNDATKVYLRIRHGAYGATGDGNAAVTFTTDGTEWCLLFIYVQSFATLLTNGPVTLRAQLEVNATATDYEPYLGNTASLLPDGYSLRSLPDGTKDELHLSYLRPSTREGWAWYSRELVQKLHEITLNACTWLFYSATAFYTRGLNLPFTAGNVEVLCNIFKPSASKNLGGLANAEINSIQVLGRNELGIKTASEYQDVSAFVASLDDSDVAVAKLATPITTQLDPIELPIMPSQTVNVWSDPATNLKMTYIQDSNLIIENLEATIADIATS